MQFTKALSATLLTFTLFLGQFAWSQDLTPKISKWDNILEQIKISDKFMEDGQGFTYKYVEKIEPSDRNKPRTALYFTGKGVVSEDSVFHIFEVSVVFEKWAFNADGNWVINQWIFQTNLQGELLRTMHIHMVQTLDGRVLEHDGLPVGSIEEQTSLLRSLIEIF